MIWRWIIEEDRKGQSKDNEEIDFSQNDFTVGQKLPLVKNDGNQMTKSSLEWDEGLVCE